ncbi:LysM peptidoglycan-binding domain-containing protein [Fructobacillus sp. M2-14]|uniref:LysM peptidoglycan-binding domain-containing protein n=1 Tax=Fructobacillus broussonetiae TaxID=2713173 RepID=A0ABS5QZP1_9LACO|nr:CAP domain-containing protein [Fructobacillus broussonetiae]MBS9338625.1 LysM peptidoglycan-binding domain-containing protein [Fructobacillus broussonetiae]
MKNNLTKTILATLAGATALAGAGVSASANDVTVKAGDTLSQIAADNNTTVEELVSHNNIADADMIYIGDVISTDGVASASATASAQEDVAASSDNVNTEAVTNNNTQADDAVNQNVDYSAYSAGSNGAVQTIINAMNAKRAAYGLAPVSYDASLASVAQGRAANAVANGGLPTGHFEQVAGPEVVAIDFSPSAVVDAWFNETNMVAAPAHHNWLINGSFTKVGFGIVDGTIVGIAG